jgi:peroxiredoxin
MKKSIVLFACFAVAALIFTSTTYLEIDKNEASISSSSDIQIGGYKIGDTAADFNLKNIDGKMVSLADYPDAKGYIVIFTCNSCPYAVMYEDRIIELHNNFASKGYPVIAINPNDVNIKPTDSFENMQKRAEEKGFDFPYLYDEKQDIFPVYGATKTPHVFLLNNKKVVEYIGAIDDNAQDASAVSQKYLENAITALENGEKPDPASTRAIGCSIKYKK